MRPRSWHKRIRRWLTRPKRRAPRPRRTGRSAPVLVIPKRYTILLMLLALIAAFAYSYYRFDRRVVPMVLEAAEMRIQTEINNVINNVIQEIIAERSLTATDFILQHDSGEAGMVLSVNTVLVNEICNAAAMRISYILNNMPPETVSVPMGMAFGLDTLAQVGPRFEFLLAPIGNALVDYETRFLAVGINQTHFSVWLTVESEVRIINPVHSDTIFLTRHVSLVDTIISGVVPDTYLNVDSIRGTFD